MPCIKIDALAQVPGDGDRFSDLYEGFALRH